jgi:hypothetical protein
VVAIIFGLFFQISSIEERFENIEDGKMHAVYSVIQEPQSLPLVQIDFGVQNAPEVKEAYYYYICGQM